MLSFYGLVRFAQRSVLVGFVTLRKIEKSRSCLSVSFSNLCVGNPSDVMDVSLHVGGSGAPLPVASLQQLVVSAGGSNPEQPGGAVWQTREVQGGRATV